MPDTAPFLTPRPVLAWSLAAYLAVVAAYLPDLGRGFIKDDFAWILGSRFQGLSGVFELFTRHNGFYRPWVALSFSTDETLHGLHAFGYGITNLLLVLAAMLVLQRVARALGQSGATATLAVALWGLNPHGIGGAILWLSGRTSLWLTLFALLAALASLRQQPWLAALACLLALFSKEEAVLLPFVLAAWAGLGAGQAAQARWNTRAAAQTLGWLLVPLALYLALRLRTSAFLPGSAPSYYRPSLQLGLLGRNLLEYADRSATLTLVAVSVAAVVARVRPRFTTEMAWLGVLGAAWWVGGFGLTFWLPVRSSLYVLLPSIGVSLVGAALLSSIWSGATPPARRRLLLAAALGLVAIVPLLWSRNVRMKRIAELSARTLATVQRLRPELAAGKTLVLLDQPDDKVSFSAAFGSLAREAVRLQTNLPEAQAWIEPPPKDWEAAGLQRPRGATVELRLADVR